MAAKKKVKSAYIERAVRTLNDRHLKSFSNIYNSQEFDDLKEVVENIKYNTMVSFFQLDHLREPKYLAQEGAFAKGTIFGLKTLIRIIESIPEEVDRRESRTKRSK
ncbi:MAG: hypothetical protein [Podoviridae sp. ctg2L5]|nr:MAG: hypothetical protein [Podoviridae sp. ctg2L5]